MAWKGAFGLAVIFFRHSALPSTIRLPSGENAAQYPDSKPSPRSSNFSRVSFELGRPYCISIDRSEEYDRLWRLNKQVWDERAAEMWRET